MTMSDTLGSRSGARNKRVLAPGFLAKTNPQCARVRVRGRLSLNSRGFRRGRSSQEMLRECSDSAHPLHSKKPLPWRVTGTYVARHVERPLRREWVVPATLITLDHLLRMRSGIGFPVSHGDARVTLRFENSAVYQDTGNAFEAAQRSIVATTPG